MNEPQKSQDQLEALLEQWASHSQGLAPDDLYRQVMQRVSVKSRGSYTPSRLVLVAAVILLAASFWWLRPSKHIAEAKPGKSQVMPVPSEPALPGQMQSATDSALDQINQAIVTMQVQLAMDDLETRVSRIRDELRDMRRTQFEDEQTVRRVLTREKVVHEWILAHQNY